MRIARSTRTLPALANLAGRLLGAVLVWLCALDRRRDGPHRPAELLRTGDPRRLSLLDDIDGAAPLVIIHGCCPGREGGCGRTTAR